MRAVGSLDQGLGPQTKTRDHLSGINTGQHYIIIPLLGSTGLRLRRPLHEDRLLPAQRTYTLHPLTHHMNRHNVADHSQILDGIRKVSAKTGHWLCAGSLTLA